LDGRCGVLIPSPRVSNSQIQNLVFCRPCFFLLFSIVSYNNYGGDSKLCFFQILIFGLSSHRDFGCDSGTREQMMLQVDMVRFSSGAGKTHGNNFIDFYHLWFWNKGVIYYETVLVFYWILRRFELRVIFIMK